MAVRRLTAAAGCRVQAIWHSSPDEQMKLPPVLPANFWIPSRPISSQAERIIWLFQIPIIFG